MLIDWLMIWMITNMETPDYENESKIAAAVNTNMEIIHSFIHSFRLSLQLKQADRCSVPHIFSFLKKEHCIVRLKGLGGLSRWASQS